MRSVSEHGVGSRSGVAIDDELHLDSAPPHLEGDQPGEFEVSRPATSQFSESCNPGHHRIGDRRNRRRPVRLGMISPLWR